MSRARRTPGDGGLYKRSDGLWVASVEIPTTDGRRRRKTVSSRDRNETIRKMRDLQSAVAGGHVPTTSTTTVAAWLDKWLPEIRGPHIKPETYTWYEKAIRLYIKPHIGAKRLGRLTAEDVRKTIVAVQDNQGTRAAQKAHQTLNTALKDAVREGLISRNVVDAVRKPRHKAAEQVAFSAPMAQRLIATAIDIDNGRDDPKLAARWVAGFFTGARRGELLGLTWDRVHLDADDPSIDICWQLQQMSQEHGCGGTCGRQKPGYCPERRWRVPPGFEMVQCHKSLAWTRPKTDAGVRLVPLTPFMVATLRAHQAMDTGVNPQNLVFHWSDGRPISPHADHDEWKKLLAAAGFEDTVQHGLRHSTATLLQQTGSDQDTRMKIMGHSSAAAQAAYVHVALRPALDALSRLDALMAPGSD